MSISSQLASRFSFGGYLSDLVNVAVWKFDVLVNLQDRPARLTAYASCPIRADAFAALFSAHPLAKVFGTGLPLSALEANREIGRQLSTAEVLIVDARDEFVRELPSARPPLKPEGGAA